jgi:hypothetical protein
VQSISLPMSPRRKPSVQLVKRTGNNGKLQRFHGEIVNVLAGSDKS